jgi:hypothetical protein
LSTNTEILLTGDCQWYIGLRYYLLDMIYKILSLSFHFIFETMLDIAQVSFTVTTLLLGTDTDRDPLDKVAVVEAHL